MRTSACMRWWPALAVAATLAGGCRATPAPAEEISRLAEATVILQLPDQVKRDVVDTYRAWVDDVRSPEAEKMLDAFVSYGLEDREISEAFALSVEALAGSTSADGQLRILDRAVLAGRIEAPELLHLLRAVRDAAKANVNEKVMVRGVHALAVWRFRSNDMADYIRGLPLAKAGPDGSVAGDAVLIYKFMLKLRIPPKYRAEIYTRGVQALSRGMYVEDYGKFFRFLIAGRVPKKEVVQYCTFLARRANDKVELATIAPGYDAVEDLPLPADRRLALFEGVVAAAAAGADPNDVAAALDAVRKGRRDLDAATLEGVAELILRAFSAYDSALVNAAVTRALATKAETGEALAEALSLELSRVAASRRRAG